MGNIRHVSGNFSLINANKPIIITGFFSYNGKDYYTNHPDTVNDHHAISLGNINNNVLAVGDSWSYSGIGPRGSTEVEMFDINSNTWSSKTSFPYCSSQ